MSVSMNQRMVSGGGSPLEVKRLGGYQQGLLMGRGGSVTFWAWTASIVVHLIVLTVFGFVEFSPCQRQAGAKTQLRDGPIPTAKVSQIKKLIEAAPIIPKPKIKKPSRGEFALISDGDKKLKIATKKHKRKKEIEIASRSLSSSEAKDSQ